MKYELDKMDFEIYENDIYLLPTVRVYINDMMYIQPNFSIEFHFLIFHGRLFFVKKRYKF